MENEDIEIRFDCYFSDLRRLAEYHGERVADRDAWRQRFDDGLTADEAFYDEYPEHISQ